MATMKDPEFLKEAATNDIDVDPVDGETMRKVAEELISAPKAIKDRARPLVE